MCRFTFSAKLKQRKIYEKHIFGSGLHITAPHHSGTITQYFFFFLFYAYIFPCQSESHPRASLLSLNSPFSKQNHKKIRYLTTYVSKLSTAYNIANHSINWSKSMFQKRFIKFGNLILNRMVLSHIQSMYYKICFLWRFM